MFFNYLRGVFAREKSICIIDSRAALHICNENMGLQDSGFWKQFPTFFLIGNTCILIEVTLNFNIP